MSSDDQQFLLYFIMGTYFGPDLKGERTRKSALQRKAENLAPYTKEELTGSHIRTSEIEQIYCFLLRKADKSVVAKLATFHRFIEGQDGMDIYPSFNALFPPDLHPQTESHNGSRIIADVVFIRNPIISYIEQEDIERFKKLTGLEDLFVENPILGEELEDEDAEKTPILTYFRGSPRKRWLNDIMDARDPVKLVHESPSTPEPHEMTLPPPTKQVRAEVGDGPGMVILPARPTREKLNHIVEIARDAYALTGSAAKGQVGPVIGLMDLGESEDSYLFRVALPGVKKENRAFQCEVESDGKVLIRGETVTGEKRVQRYSQDFVMQTQNLCPSGPFSVLFQLPGPVDPQRFTGSFGTDGILEGTVMKQQPPRPT